MSLPEFWLIAGPNGAGKTTITQTPPISGLLRVRFLNPDDRTLELLKSAGFGSFSAAERQPDVLRRLYIQAAAETQAEVERRLRMGGTIGVETVLSTRKYQGIVHEVLRVGGHCFLIYMALNSPEVSAARVRLRASMGGHDVPVEKLRERWRRSLELLPWFASRCRRFWIYDNSNSDADRPAELIANGSRRDLTLLNASAIPELTGALIGSGLFTIRHPPA